MAKTKPSAPTLTEKAKLAQANFQAAYDNLTPQRNIWPELERFHFSKTRTQLQKQGLVVSSVDDSRLSTLAFERAARIMAQLPTGKFNALSQKDKGKSELMQTVWDRYILPNANGQFDFLTKLRLVEVYSTVYGSQPVIYDWSVTDSYVGPDFWLVPLRNFFPQPGKTSIQDSDWCMISTTRSLRWLKGRKDVDGYDNKAIDFIAGDAQNAIKNPTLYSNTERMSFIERNRTTNASPGEGDSAQIELVTLYEAGKDGHWITFCPDFGWTQVSDRPNPHKDGRIPVILKHCFPLIDSMIGLGDYERGMGLQKARMSLLNMYMDTVKMGLYPPLMINTSKIDVASSIQWAPAAKWLTTGPDAIQPFPSNPQGLQTFESAWNTMTSSLLNMHGTTDTSISQNTDAAYGRTPQALNQQAERENARDNWDRFHIEQFVENLGSCMVNLFANRQEVAVDIEGVLADEIKKLRLAYPNEDVEGWVKPRHYPKVTMNDSEQGGSVRLPAKALANTTYRFTIDASSTLKRDQNQEFQSLSTLFTTLVQSYQIIGPVLQQEGKNVDFGELIKRLFITASIEDYEKILTDTQAQAQQQNGGMPQIPGITTPGPQAGQPMPAMQPQNNFTDPAVAKAAATMFGSTPGGQ